MDLKQERQSRRRKLRAQYRAASLRKRFGPRRQPSPVVTRLATGEVVDRPYYARSLNRAARDEGYPSYADFLRSPAWATARAATLARDRVCTRCRGSELLNVHHRRYDIGLTNLAALVTLCRACHREVHGR